MKKLMAKLSRVLVLAMIVTCIPVGVFGVSYSSIKADEQGDYSPVIGENYSISGYAGKESLLIFEFPESEDVLTDENGNSIELVVIESAVSSNTSVVETEIDKEDPELSDCVDLYYKKAGSATVTVKDNRGVKSIIKVTVKEKTLKSKIEATNWIYKNSQKVNVKAKNVKKGDIIKLTIGKKTYKKKVTKTASTYKVKIKIKKPGFYGKKYKLTLNRKGKVVAKEQTYVYLSNYVHVGDSKKKVKWLTNWNDPVQKNQYTYSEQWCYDWNDDGLFDAYLHFNNKGKVTSWTIYDV